MTKDKAEVIYSYSSEQAVEDGVLVQPDPKAPGILIARSIHVVCSTVTDGRRYMDKVAPLLLDACMAVRKPIESGSDEWPVVLEHTVAGTVWIMPNDLGGITLMKPEDY